ncbi:hypothetical protein EV426DRAFT_617629 [Tirmania nivea]|nr:hypothetical protein EV426DRAFT_617629 [Tirmania nivea]
MEAAAQFLLETTTAAVRSALGLGETASMDVPSANNANAMSNYGDDAELVYIPSVQDILEVKEIIQEASRMPLELIDAVIDFAEYWACNTIKSLVPQIVIGKSVNADHRDSKAGNILVLRSHPLGYAPACGYLSTDSDRREYQRKAAKPLFPDSDLSFLEPDTTSVLKQWASHTIPRGKNPCRRIVFTICSMDQGWGGRPEHHGTYQGSYSWFDVGLERFTALKYSEPEDRVQTEDQKAISFPAYGRDYWPARSEGRVEWIASSVPLTGVQPPTSSARGNTIPAEPSGSGYTPPSVGNSLKYNLLTIIPKTLTGLEYLRHDHPFLPPPTRLQTNVMGSVERKTHIITWSFDDDVKPDSAEGDELEQQGRGRESMTGEFVRSLKLGDVVTVWARARFPGWRNKVFLVKMDIYWAV